MADKDDPFDLENLRLAPEKVAALYEAAEKYKAAKATTKAPAGRSRNREFVMVPFAWVEKLKGARHVATYRLAHHILYRDWKDRGKPVALTNVATVQLGVERRAKWRAIRELERLGLITVERRRRRSPLIRLQT